MVTTDNLVAVNDNPKYRSYVSAVEKVLKSFEFTTEWADLISTLEKLKKVLASNRKGFNVVPKSVTIAKRLAQCLHQNLPFGVHLKAIETYTLIFNIIGVDGLSSDLAVYSLGLYPLFANATMNVKSKLIELYENYYIPLNEGLRPGLSGLLTGILYGLEDEGTEFYDRTHSLVDKIRIAVGNDYFFACLWECIIHSSSIRLPALRYVLNHFDRRKSLEDQLYIMGTNVNRTVTALCASGFDTNVLVLRCLLDLLCTLFPLESTYLIEDDQMKILQSVLFVVLKRDMSLNRRLYTLLLGPDLNNTELSYFEKHSRKLIASALHELLRSAESRQSVESVVQIMRLILYILDKPEFGNFVLEDLFLSLLHACHQVCDGASTTATTKDVSSPIQLYKTPNDKKALIEDLRNNLNMLCNALDPGFTWDFIEKRMQRCLSRDCLLKAGIGLTCNKRTVANDVGKPENHLQIMRLCTVAQYALKSISLDTHSDIRTKHLPKFLLTLVASTEPVFDLLSYLELMSVFDLCQVLLNNILDTTGCIATTSQIAQERRGSFEECLIADEATTSSSCGTSPAKGDSERPESCLSSDYGSGSCSPRRRSGSQASLEFLHLVTETQNLVRESFHSFLRIVAHAFDSVIRIAVPNSTDNLQDFVATVCRVLRSFAEFPLYCTPTDWEQFSDPKQINDLPPWVKSLCSICLHSDVRVLDPCFTVFLQLMIISESLVDQWQAMKNLLSSATKRSRGTLPVLLHPPLSGPCLQLIRISSFFEKLFTLLWDGLDDCGQHQQRLAELLCYLHSAELNKQSSMFEDYLVARLADPDESQCLKAVKKFAILWSTLRHCNVEKFCSGLSAKQFDRALLFVTKKLAHSSNLNVRQHCILWLSSCLKQGDLSRILQSLLLTNLMPKTARVLLNHLVLSPISIEHKTKTGISNLFAMCSEGAEVPSLYHCNSLQSPDQYELSAEMNESLLKANACVALTMTLLRSQSVDLKQHDAEFDNFYLEATTTQCSSVAEALEENEVDDGVAVEVIRKLLDQLVDTVVQMNANEDEELASARRLSTAALMPIVQHNSVDEMSLFGDCCSVSSVPAVAGSGLEEVIDDEFTEYSPSSNMHRSHNHMCLYYSTFDAEAVRLSYRTLLTLIETNPRQFVYCAAASVTGEGRSVRSQKLIELFQRHSRSLRGENFFSDIAIDTYKTSLTYLELLVTSTLYYLRSFYPNNPMLRSLSDQDLQKNAELKFTCLDFLTKLLSELQNLIVMCGKSFAFYINDVLGRDRSKMQMTLTHLLAVSLQEMKLVCTDSDISSIPLSSHVLLFNWRSSNTVKCYQSRLIQLTESAVKLEHALKNCRSEVNRSGIRLEKLSVNRSSLSPEHSLKFQSLVEDKLFLKTVLTAMRQNFDSLDIWIGLVISCLPYMEQKMGMLVLHFVDQLCQNIEHACVLYSSSSSLPHLNIATTTFPPNFIVLCLDALGAVCQCCLSDSFIIGSESVPVSVLSDQQHNQGSTGEILGNLFRVFTLGDPTITGQPSNQNKLVRPTNQHLQAARQDLLGALPQIHSTIVRLWSAIKLNNSPRIPVGQPHVVRRQILELLAPVALQNSRHFLSAFALVWMNRMTNIDVSDNLKAEYSDSQLDIVDLLLSLRVIQPDILMSAIKNTLSDPVKVKHSDQKIPCPLELFLLEILHGCVKSSPVTFKGFAVALCTFIGDALQLNSRPRSTFLCFMIFSEFVNNNSTLVHEDKTLIRTLQDMSSKLIDIINSIVAWQLQQTTWLKRTLVVKSDISSAVTDLSPSASRVNLSNCENGEVLKSSSTKRINQEASASTQAIFLLAKMLVPIIDCLYKSDDRDKSLVLLSTVWFNIQPYLKAHSQRNAGNFEAASLFLANLSQFSYTRPVWRKAALDVLSDSQFFQMTSAALHSWMIIVDNLTTQDKVTFKELMSRISVSQGPSLFSNKDQEYELRSQMLKRLAFTLFSSEKDQYETYLPDIQERLSENLRLYQVPHVHAQVFLVFRVMLLRLSSHHLTLLWPSFISELVQVLMLIEQELSGVDIDDDYRCAREDQWLELYLSAVKLLDTLLNLPSDFLPQFQLYEWAFTAVDVNEKPNKSVKNCFVPYVERIRKAYNLRKQETYQNNVKKSSRSALRFRSLQSLEDLRPFFMSLHSIDSSMNKNSKSIQDAADSQEEVISRIGKYLEVDFLERMN